MFPVAEFIPWQYFCRRALLEFGMQVFELTSAGFGVDSLRACKAHFRFGGAGKWPVAQACFCWVVFDVAGYTLLFGGTADPTVKVVPAPEGTGSFQQAVAFLRCGLFDSGYDSREIGLGINQQVNVVRHDYPGT